MNAASLSNITEELNTTISTTTFSVGVYMLALGFFPLFVSFHDAWMSSLIDLVVVFL